MSKDPNAPPAYATPDGAGGYPQQSYPPQQQPPPQQAYSYPGAQQPGYQQQQPQQPGFQEPQQGYPGQPYPQQGYPAQQYPTQPYPVAGAPSHIETGSTIEQLGGSCIDCFQGPPGIPADHPLGGCSCDEFVHGWCICCGFGQIMHFNGESVDASPCNPGLCYFFPYIGGILGFMVHYPLRQRLENKLVTGSTVGAVATCPPVDACCTFCFPACHMCQELRAVRGAMYRSQTASTEQTPMHTSKQ